MNTLAETNREAPTLPTREELAAAEKRLQHAYDAVERVAWGLADVHKYGEDNGQLPDGAEIDDAYVGVLWRRLSDYRTQAAQIQAKVDCISELLDEIDLDGRDADWRQKVVAS